MLMNGVRAVLLPSPEDVTPDVAADVLARAHDVAFRHPLAAMSYLGWKADTGPIRLKANRADGLPPVLATAESGSFAGFTGFRAAGLRAVLGDEAGSPVQPLPVRPDERLWLVLAPLIDPDELAPEMNRGQMNAIRAGASALMATATAAMTARDQAAQLESIAADGQPFVQKRQARREAASLMAFAEDAESRLPAIARYAFVPLAEMSEPIPEGTRTNRVAVQFAS